MKSANPQISPAEVIRHSMLSMSEAEFTRRVLAEAKRNGWRSAHFRPAMNARGQWRTAVQGEGAGFPDIVLVRAGVVIVAELKVGRNKPRAEQLHWLFLFREAGIPAFVWRPEEWRQIVGVLSTK